ncbi:MAG TPA: poly-gamma-glutamate synthase PgsB [Lacipirellulaceae bacterium]|nr:poly-gamma-glutamate synthase PgsB [Lacipirellulaceae bacterium]
MSAIAALCTTTGLLVGGGAWELAAHRRRLAQIPVRIHVNGTRGKSSVARLIAAGLRFAGKRTCCKTTGTLPRMIMPDGSEYPVFRPAKANVIEQIRIVAAAVEAEAEVLVLECMALVPQLQWLCEDKLVRATHGVITNAREDHLDVMGPTGRDVAKALAGMIPPRGKLYTADRDHLDFFAAACADRKCEFYPTSAADVAAIAPLDLAGFSYVEHAENIALALRVCASLGVDRASALRGMWKAKPDPGAMTAHEMNFFNREINFVNGFAANDPQSTELIWNLARERYADVEKRIAIFNCREDRPDRSRQLGSLIVNWAPADHYLLIGSGTYIFAKYAVKAGLDPRKLVIAEDRRPEEIFEIIVELTGRRSLAMGMANIGGIGLDVVRYFANRSTNRIFK